MNELEKHQWSDWRRFPNPNKKEYLYAPYGFGLYQLKNTNTGELILFGIGKNCAFRMSSLLPAPLGQGRRNNESKRDYVLNNIDKMEYRTISFITDIEMKKVEKEIKDLKLHKFNT